MLKWSDTTKFVLAARIISIFSSCCEVNGVTFVKSMRTTGDDEDAADNDDDTDVGDDEENEE